MLRKLLIVCALLLPSTVFGQPYFGYTNQTATTLTAMAAGAFDLTGQAPDMIGRPHWQYYSTYNCPEACWQSYFDVNSPSSTMTGTFTLYQNPPATVTPITLSAGTYHGFLFGYELGEGGTMELTCGSATSGTITPNDRDYNAKWSTAVTLTVVTPCTAWTLTIHKGAGDSHFLFRGFRLTTNLATIALPVGASDVANEIDLTYPSVMDDSTAIAGNLIRNSGFENPMDGEWGLYPSKTTYLQDMRQSSCTVTAHTGTGCLKIPLDSDSNIWPSGAIGQINSRVFHLKANKKYTFSAWVRVGSGTSPVVLAATNTFAATLPVGIGTIVGGSGYTTANTVATTGGSGTGLTVNIVAVAGVVTSVIASSQGRNYLAGEVITISGGGGNATFVTLFNSPDECNDNITATTSWQRKSITCYMRAFPTADFNFNITDTTASAGNFLYVDDVQLEEGDTANTYAAANALDCTLSTSLAGHIYFSGVDTLTAVQSCRNSSGSTATGTLNYVIYDYLDNIVVPPSAAALSIAATTTSSTTLSVATGGKTGPFRIVTWLTGVNNSDKEFAYAIIPRPNNYAVSDQPSHMGSHTNFITPSFDILQRLGVKWDNTLSPAAWCRWELIEAVEGVFVYRDADLAVATAHNVEPVCNIGSNSGTPAYGFSGGTPILAKYAALITAVVAHYKTLGLHWYECWNEPQFTATVYAGILKTCVDAILAEDPTAKIVGMGGLSKANIDATLTALDLLDPTTKTKLNALSGHAYVEGADPATWTPLNTMSGYALWNTEAGDWDQGPHHGLYSNFVAWGTPMLPYITGSRFYEASIKAPAAIASNFTSTIAALFEKYFFYDSRLQAAPNYFQHHPTLFEYDGSVRHKAIAYAIAGHFMDHGLGSGNASLNANSQFYVFDNGASDPVAYLYSTDNAPRQVIVQNSITHGQLACYDLFANAITITGTTVPYARQPTYCTGVGISAATLKTGLTAGIVSSLSDTVAPNVSIVDGPRGTVTDVTALNPLRIRWTPLDETSYPNFGEFNAFSDTQQAGQANNTPDPNAIVCSYRLVGYSAVWSDYAADTYVDYTSLPARNYTFEVRCKDAAGNVSATASRDVQLLGAVTASTAGRIRFK